MKLLIIEDTKELADAMVVSARDSGYTVDVSYDGKQAYEMARVNEYDLIVLDLNLPGYTGFEIAKMLREDEEGDTPTPIVAVTARYSIDDKLNGFEIGFDDYVTKPFDMKELLARIEAVIRRTKPNKAVILRVGNLKLDPAKRDVRKGKKDIKLTKIEFNILEFLLRNKGLVVGNSDIIETVWGEDSDTFDPPIRSHMKNLRKKIGDNNFQIIKTVPGVGFKID